MVFFNRLPTIFPPVTSEPPSLIIFFDIIILIISQFTSKYNIEKEPNLNSIASSIKYKKKLQKIIELLIRDKYLD